MRNTVINPRHTVHAFVVYMTIRPFLLLLFTFLRGLFVVALVDYGRSGAECVLHTARTSYTIHKQTLTGKHDCTHHAPYQWIAILGLVRRWLLSLNEHLRVGAHCTVHLNL
ncbi:hypothetical protein CYLTODRAFT_36535 [Cylindrobasidium torrendii FP15055 ss-10]|uniref:Uncharacterized protein n=1 Tax=Cylindrobasidium torrendii FP15055 ss-10 TaxID=1314674 RepID=A0A0D7BQJ0_9AGAR|nr:hypothetical protein CYLTODRAFT_36535 [Cylindrobasidium torrendii FP15055 ss-10]